MIFILKIILVQINFYLLFLKVVRGCWVNPFVKKDPITPDILQRIIAVFGDRNGVSKLRICVLFLLGFSGFLRYSELSNIKMNNSELQDTHVKITIEKSKTDMYRRGSSVIIAKTDNDLCPVFWLKRYIELNDLEYNSDEYICRSLPFFKSKGVHKLCTRNVPLSYTRARAILLSSLDRVGLDKSRFGLHSFGPLSIVIICVQSNCYNI